ncbi:3-ketoacyl-ACP reductase [Mesorhizobium sp. B3-1-7]|uniref:3-ketoacyl-ACP reductase n=1 Tax=Mesorhizobium sp. B3-1-7 TaxID=2589894 RepID=UPI00112AD583|nr:3-ketoacyl-ACP reductase [Mesorhizobium sp. B3-1-7]TPI58224.1 3-ketoacyl-ACP reductase [Mesorhizobium sp. B3-1-7]
MSGIAIVTGGRRGIGRAIGQCLARRGQGVLVVDLENDASDEEAVSLLKESGVPAAFMAADVGDEACHEAILDAAGELGTLTTLVNNAGVSSTVRGDMLDLPVESLDRALRINLRAPFLLSQAFSKRLIRTKAADTHFCSIVNITSVNVEILGVNRPDYCITKTGLSMATRLFAARLAEEKIHAYEVRPGITMTEMTQPSREKYDRVIEEGLVPMRRWGEPEDVGEAVANLASGAFKFSTGDAVWVDGGLHLYRL